MYFCKPKVSLMAFFHKFVMHMQNTESWHILF